MTEIHQLVHLHPRQHTCSLLTYRAKKCLNPPGRRKRDLKPESVSFFSFFRWVNLKLIVQLFILCLWHSSDRLYENSAQKSLHPTPTRLTRAMSFQDCGWVEMLHFFPWLGCTVKEILSKYTTYPNIIKTLSVPQPHLKRVCFLNFWVVSTKGFLERHGRDGTPWDHCSRYDS